MEEEMVKYVDSQSHRVVGPSKMVPSASTNLQDPLAPLAPTGTLKRRTTKKDVPASIPVKKEDDDEIVVYGDIPPDTAINERVRRSRRYTSLQAAEYAKWESKRRSQKKASKKVTGQILSSLLSE
ncbi:hypothetical protein SCLCIDRAFT_34125 [Scleroderma citrinum Foug A]|uniref:Uncharacterized protein n=1 Tax=Scleroderma citrinum Foug A TaxID=1036808 RepID=A0A0C3D2L7_9AGAM|nr:hypothetical protein SCLCIDRAFT_34125 [Scleroderma citrinum Foug A]